MTMFVQDKHKAGILIVDDHPIVREGLRARISSQSDMEVCGEAADAGEALACVKKDPPDLALVDISLAQSSGLDLIIRLKARNPQIKVLVLSAHDDSLYAERALNAGAQGYISKSQAQAKVLDAIRLVLNGGCYLSPEMNRRLVGRAVGVRASASGSGTSAPLGELSNRELQVFQMVGQGQSTKTIAADLHLSPHTIDRHREKIKAKLGLKNGLELQRAALQWTLANP